MVTYEEKVELVRQTIITALEPLEHLEPAAIIHGLTLVLGQAIVVLRGPDVKSPPEALPPVHQLLEETVREWWDLGEDTVPN